MDILVTYAINRDDSGVKHTTMHTRIIEFEDPDADDYNASDVFNRLIWQVCAEDTEVDEGQVSLVGFWEI